MLKKNRFAVLEGFPEEAPPPARRAESSNSSATTSPVILSATTPAPEKRTRPVLIDFPKERKTIGNIADPHDLAHQRTESRVIALISSVKRLNLWLKDDDIFFDDETLYRLEYELVQICEILLKLRENFKNWQYAHFVQDTQLGKNSYSPVYILRNMIVHQHITLRPEVRFEMYMDLARYLATLSEYESRTEKKPLDFDDFVNLQDTPHLTNKTVYQLIYSPRIEIILNSLFAQIAYYGKYSNITPHADHTQFSHKHSSSLIPIARAAEIIRQLIAEDPEVEIKIHGEPIDKDIIPYLMQVRNGVYHYNQEFQTSSVTEIVDYAQSVCVAKSTNRNYNI